MTRAKQIELRKSAEKRTVGYLRKWLENPKFKAAVQRSARSKRKTDARPRVREYA